MILVFGSNLAGIHGAGAAKNAHRNMAAEWGVGWGRTGMSYAIPTKDGNIQTLPIDMIIPYINDFITYATTNSKLMFVVSRIGCGLAGYTDKQIAPLFQAAPSNCEFDLAWKPFLGKHRDYWGHR